MRPEYLDALDAARWNYWFLVMLVVPPLLICAGRLAGKSGCIVFVAAFVVCWHCFGMWVGYYWDVKLQMAVTPAELHDSTADTAALYGPALVGTPFALIYCTAWVIVVAVVAWAYRFVVKIVDKQESHDSRP